MQRYYQKEERQKINFDNTPLGTVLNAMKDLVEKSDLHELDKDLYVSNLLQISKYLAKESEAAVAVTIDKMCVCPCCMSIQCSYDDIVNCKKALVDYCWGCGRKLDWDKIEKQALEEKNQKSVVTKKPSEVPDDSFGGFDLKQFSGYVNQK